MNTVAGLKLDDAFDDPDEDEIIEPGTQLPKLTMSVSWKVQPRQYENAEVFLSIGGVTADMNESDIDDLLDKSEIVYRKMTRRLKEKIEEVRTDKGF